MCRLERRVSSTSSAKVCAHSLSTPNRQPAAPTFFIELQELRGDTWTETGRWNHALEEDALPLSPGHDASDPHTWSQPRLPTISVAAVVRLQLALSPANVFLGLRADSLREIAEAMLQRLVAGGLLAAEQHERVAEALLSAKRLAPGPDSPNRGPTVAPRRRPRRRMAGFEASDAEADELFHMLDPEKGEEAASLLLAHLGFLTEPMVAFARLATPVDLGCEGQAPVRYLCLLLGPEAEAEGTSRMARPARGSPSRLPMQRDSGRGHCRRRRTPLAASSPTSTPSLRSTERVARRRCSMRSMPTSRGSRSCRTSSASRPLRG